ncbi:hypothetical protein GCM10009839_88980 [Catenulispora yoronensis]|uniref:HTH iclR-type domain-containing protein n=1 Tax=Catenulispora yoronensis TaxID=450799 RepID=A0ABP5H6A0_9ACTN
MPKKKTPAKSAPVANPQPPADTPAFPPSTLTVLAQLDSESGMTAAEVVESSGLGRSTVTKALSTLHDAGLAVRQDGGFDGTRRIADLWFAAPGASDAVRTDPDADAATDDPEQPTADDDAQAEPADGVVEPGGNTDTDTAAPDRVEGEPSLNIPTGGDSEPDERSAESGPDLDDEPTDGLAVGGAPEGEAMPDGPEADEPTHPETAEPDHIDDADIALVPEADEPESERANEPDELADGGAEGDGAVSGAAQPGPVLPVAAPVAPSAAQVAGAEASPARLGKGELRAQVEDHLREHPDRAWTPTAISKVLNRSAGAINNACEKLLETEVVTTFEDKPRRFQWRDQGASLAAS